MIARLKRGGLRIVLCEKCDRLLRNIKDWAVTDDLVNKLGVEIHLPKEGEIMSRDSRSASKFIHGIKFLMAKNYCDNLSEEVRKSQAEKLKDGWLPGQSPIGYKNVPDKDAKIRIIVDAERAPVIRRLFEWYATGLYSLEEVAKRTRAEGFSYRKTGTLIPKSEINRILKNPFYAGRISWNGKIYEGKHESIVPLELWKRVQGVMDERGGESKRKYELAYAQLLSCAKCGCAIVGEVKKGKYTYYRCTGYKSECKGNLKYVREDVLEKQFLEMLDQLRFDGEKLEWVRTALLSSHKDEQREHNEAVGKLEAEYKQLGERISTMYMDKLDGRINHDFFDEMSWKLREEQAECLNNIELHQNAEQGYMETGIRLLNLAVDAKALFERENAIGKRRLLKFLLSNRFLEGEKVSATFRKPFTMLAKTNLALAGANTEKAKNGIWRE